MAHVLVLERSQPSQWERRRYSIGKVLGSLGRTVIKMSAPAEVLSYLRGAEEPVDAVALSVWRPESPDSFAVVKELCQDSVLREVGKILVFSRQADPEEEERMYGSTGVASLEPHFYRTVIVCESRLLALREALSMLSGEG